ncbi:polymorphic toxin type 24 domain-containing protein [Carbonactinospora thermoautotrophica]|uniref:polymorphic toxin type 24 domain-containing protein n=1 Tax=Carbonactinospora thermoautotrophica TaxID=1469144 RepID=UPI00099F05DA|nr:polymorphic toxin type 24 domain-containing protein [Carbonactinospora thermoautotrophica]
MLQQAGVKWPEADEDQLYELAGVWRAFATDLRSIASDGSAIARAVGAEHYGQSIDAFTAHWYELQQNVERYANAVELTAEAVDGTAKSVLHAKAAMADALTAVYSRILQARGNAVAAASFGRFLSIILRFLANFVGRILAALWRFVVQVISGLFKIIAAAIRKIIEFFKRLFSRKPKPQPQPPVYRRDGKLPHARDLIRNGTLYSGRRLPLKAGPNQVLYKRDPATGKVTNYAVYDEHGYITKRVDVVGRSHGGVPTPHVVDYRLNRNPETGQVYPGPASKLPRPARPEELP